MGIWDAVNSQLRVLTYELSGQTTAIYQPRAVRIGAGSDLLAGSKVIHSAESNKRAGVIGDVTI